MSSKKNELEKVLSASQRLANQNQPSTISDLSSQKKQLEIKIIKLKTKMSSNEKELLDTIQKISAFISQHKDREKVRKYRLMEKDN